MTSNSTPLDAQGKDTLYLNLRSVFADHDLPVERGLRP